VSGDDSVPIAKKVIAMFYDKSCFPFVKELEGNWKTIRDEFDKWPTRFATWYGEEKWKTSVLYDGLDNQTIKKNEENARLFPRTVQIIDSIPGVTSAAASRMEPGKWILPHRDNCCFVRCHLGLVVPPGCGIRVGGQVRTWEEGKCLILNANSVHSAWNTSDRDRTVLIVDVRPEALGFPLEQAIEPPSFGARIAAPIQFAHYLMCNVVRGTSGAVVPH